MGHSNIVAQHTNLVSKFTNLLSNLTDSMLTHNLSYPRFVYTNFLLTLTKLTDFVSELTNLISRPTNLIAKLPGFQFTGFVSDLIDFKS